MNKEYKLCHKIHVKNNIEKNYNDQYLLLNIKLKVIGELTNLSHIFADIHLLYYVEDISKLNT